MRKLYFGLVWFSLLTVGENNIKSPTEKYALDFCWLSVFLCYLRSSWSKNRQTAGALMKNQIQLKPNFSKKSTFENGLHAKSLQWTCSRSPWGLITIWTLWASRVCKHGKFSMKSIFKSWFLGKLWLYIPFWQPQLVSTAVKSRIRKNEWEPKKKKGKKGKKRDLKKRKVLEDLFCIPATYRLKTRGHLLKS